MHEGNGKVPVDSNFARSNPQGKNPKDTISIKSSYTNKTRNGTHVLILTFCHELKEKSLCV